MPKKAIDILKSFFETGDRPTQAQFADLIDSFHHKDGAALINSKSYDPETGAVNIQFTDNSSLNFTIPTSFTIAQIEQLQEELDDKVDKVAGKGLSANDFTNYFKSLLSSAGSHINDATQHVSAQDRVNWDNKVSQEAGKGLSTNDYDDDEAQKVQNATEHINDNVRHLTPESVASFTENLRAYKVGDFISESQGNVHRIYQNAIYKFNGVGDPEDENDDVTYPFELVDFATELAAGRWVLVMSAEDANNLIVRVKDQEQILNKVLDSGKLYSIEIDLDNNDNTKSIIVPVGGLTIRGFGFNTTTLKCGAGCTLFKSASGGSGDLVIQDLTAQAVGAGAQIFDIEDVDGSHAIELEYVNFSGSTNLGKIYGYRQGTATTIGVYGCQDGFELGGNVSGFKVSNTNVFGFSSTGTLFKKGTGLSFSNRFFLNVNIDFPTGAVLCDFDSSNFQENELMQINSSIAKVDGVINIDNAAALVPNISANDLKSLWVGNIGLPDSAAEALVEDSTVTGAYVVDWLKDSFFLTMTGDTTFTEKNLPASSKNTQEIRLYLTGEFTPTFPAAWLQNSVGTYKGTDVNEIAIKYIKNGLYFVRISNSLTVYPAPILGTVNPSGVPPSSTVEVRFKGSFFTPQSVVKVENCVVNSIEFDPDTGDLVTSLTIPSGDNEYNVEISNGTNVVFENRLIVVLGDVFIANSQDWENITNPIDFSVGSVLVKSFKSIGSAELIQRFDVSKDFSYRFTIRRTPLDPIQATNTAITPSFALMELRDEVTNNLIFKIDNFQAQNIQIDNTDGSLLGRYAIGANIYDSEMRINYIGGVWSFSGGKSNINLTSQQSQNLTNNIKLLVRTGTFDLVNVKYIELAN